MLLAAGAALGLLLIYTGTAHSEFRWLYSHIVLCMAGVGCLLAEWMGRRGWVSSNAVVRLVVCFACWVRLGGPRIINAQNRWATKRGD